jgi:hypothetical protein
MNYNGAFNPKYLSGTQLYFAKNTATVSSWNDQSPNGYNLSQAVALQQPTIGANSVDFDGSNDVFFNSVTSPFISDTQGIFFFGGYITSGVVNNFFNVSLSTGALARNRFTIDTTTAGNLRFFIRDGGATLANAFQTNDTFSSGYVYGYVVSNGSSYTVYVNGSSRTLTFTNGTNNGNWFNFVGATDRMSIGGLFSNSTVFYFQAKVNKLYYNNGTLSASDLWKVREFMSNPLNYD